MTSLQTKDTPSEDNISEASVALAEEVLDEVEEDDEKPNMKGFVHTDESAEKETEEDIDEREENDVDHDSFDDVDEL